MTKPLRVSRCKDQVRPDHAGARHDTESVHESRDGTRLRRFVGEYVFDHYDDRVDDRSAAAGLLSRRALGEAAAEQEPPPM